MFNRWIEDGLTGAASDLGFGMIAFCPLYQGLLTHKYLNGIPQDSRAANTDGLIRDNELSDGVISVVRGLNGIAGDRGQSLAQMALAWVLRDKRVTSALMGASSVRQIKDNCAAVENLDFATDELAAIDAELAKLSLPGSLWATD